VVTVRTRKDGARIAPTEDLMRARSRTISSRLLISLAIAAPALVGLSAQADATPAASTGLAAPAAQARRPMVRAGELAPPSTRDALVIAREVVDAHAGAVRAADFRHERTFEPGDGSRIVALGQTFDGVPVLGRGARVLVQADGRATMLTSQLEDERPVTTVASVSKDFAFEVAARAMKGALVANAPTTLVIAPSYDGAPRLAYLIEGGIAGLPARPTALVDARTGALIGMWDRSVYERQARVYEFNPKKTPTLITTTMTNTNATSTDGLDNDRVTSRNCIDKKTVRSINFGGFNINAHVCDLIPTVKANTTGDYTDIAPAGDTEPEDSYAELSMFYHTDKAYKHAKDLGLTSTTKLTAIGNLRVPQGYQSMDLTALADPNLKLLPFDNAFFAPNDPIFSSIFGLSGDAMWFGQGTFIDFGYDGDVVYHEFGHFVVNETAKLGGDPHLDEFGMTMSPGALNEGTADIYSFFIAGDPCTGEYSSKGFTTDACIRNAENSETIPDALIGEVHQDSNGYSAAVWAAYKPLDTTKRLAFQKAWLKGMMMMPSGNLGFGDWADVEVASITQNVDAATGDALRKAFDDRGVTTTNPRVRSYAGAPIKSFVPQQGLYAIGTDAFSSGAPKLVPGLFQVKYDAPAGGHVTFHVTFKKLATSGGGNPLGGNPPAFKPTLLAKTGGDPIKFVPKPLSHDAIEAPCTITGTTGSCDVTLDVFGKLDTTAAVHFMIANAGGGANIDAITVANDELVADPALQPAPDPEPVAAAESSGCSCETPGTTSTRTNGLALLAAGAFATLVAKRRRR
jgi:MYXO-CTERM domain-containing protein